MRSFAPITTALVLIAAPVFAQSPKQTTTAPTPEAQAAAQTLSQQDRTFIKEAASGRAEMESGKHVMERAENPAVREFGRWMVTDHTLADQMLHKLVEATGAELPGSIESKAQDMVNRLQKLQGAELDRSYINAMVEDHKEDVEHFRTEIRAGQNPQVKAFAQQMIPILEQHLAEAEELQKHLPRG